MDATDVELRACYARNRPPKGAAVHWAVPGADHGLCGVLRGGPAKAATVTCRRCRDTVDRMAGPPPEPAAAALSEAELVIREAEAALAGPPMALMRAAEGLDCWLLWFPFSPLLLSIVRGIPGTRWDKESKCWLVPTSMVSTTRQRLQDAGVHVSHEPPPAAYAWYLALLTCGDAAFAAYTRLCQALPADSPARGFVEQAWQQLSRQRGGSES